MQYRILKESALEALVEEDAPAELFGDIASTQFGYEHGGKREFCVRREDAERLMAMVDREVGRFARLVEIPDDKVDGSKYAVFKVSFAPQVPTHSWKPVRRRIKKLAEDNGIPIHIIEKWMYDDNDFPPEWGGGTPGKFKRGRRKPKIGRWYNQGVSGRRAAEMMNNGQQLP